MAQVIGGAGFHRRVECRGKGNAGRRLEGVRQCVLANPVDAQFLEHAFDTRLEKTVDNPSELRYEGPGPVFGDDSRVENLTLTDYVNGSPAPVVVATAMSGRCIPIEEIDSAFRNTKLISLPTHGYPDAVSLYNAQADNGLLSFLVNYRSRCLSTIKIFKQLPGQPAER